MIETQNEQAPGQGNTLESELKPSAKHTVLEVRVVTGTGGGPDKTILNSPRFLRQYGYETICAYMRPPNDAGFDVLRQRAKQWDAPLIEIDDRGPLDYRVFRSLLQICRENNVTIWHGHDYKSNAIGVILRRFWPMKLVTTVHGWVRRTMRTPLYYAVDRLSLRFFDKVVCVSEDLVEKSVQAGVPRSKCVLIENAIDTEYFQRTMSREESRKKLGVEPSRLLIGAMGRLSAEKGFDRLIQAASRLIADGMDFQLVIAGEGAEHDKLAELIRESGHTDRIRLLGFCQDTLLFHQALDIFALSSLREGLPNVVLESMAVANPVVATQIAGLPRLIQTGSEGILVPPDDVDALYQSLKELIASPETRQSMGACARSTVEQRFSFARRMELFRNLFDEMLAVQTTA
ncbi:MAG: glycosyltransferase family 4 protein [Planctomycetota bacterium]|nr:glycosyltransferase family 4 protein [Planctomycetota bacterium]